MTQRRQEIRELLKLTPEIVRQRAGEQLLVCRDVDALHRQMAQDILTEIEAHATSGQPLRLILPVGPTGQYPLLAQMIAERRTSLAHCWFFFMDEYCGLDGQSLDPTHPLSFRRVAQDLFFSRLPDDTDLNPEQVFFPNQENIADLPTLIEALGGIDTCYGGIGIHGHMAFNEPEPGVSHSTARKVRLNDFTVTINAIRSQVGGNLENFPHEAYTLGMREILASRRIRLYCRNGSPYDWANTVLRLALFGTPGDDYPVTHIRGRAFTIITDEDTLASPSIIL